MSKLPSLRPKELAKVLLKLGFASRSGKGSHVIFFRADGKKTSIPMHPKPIGKGLLVKILRQVDVSRDEVLRNL